MAEIYVCKKISKFKLENYKTVGVFYFAGPVLRHCDFSRIKGEEDVLRYFREKSPETIKHQAEFVIPGINPWKMLSTEYIKKVVRRCIEDESTREVTTVSSLIRYNSKSEGYQRFEEFAGEGDIVIDDIPLDFLYNLIIPITHFTMERWDYLYRSIKGNTNQVIERYMRRRWIEENGLTLLEPLSVVERGKYE